MNNLLINVNKRDRSVSLSNNYIGNAGENLQEKLIFSFTDSFVNGVARLEYKIDDETYYVMLNKEGETYNLPITSVITKLGVIACQLVINEDGSNYPIFKSDEFLLYCKDSINANTPQPENYPTWIDSASVIVNEASNLNITSNNIENGIEIYFTNKQGSTTKRVLYNGRDGENGQDGQDGQDYILTNADKEEIANIVLNNLVNGEEMYF